MLRPSFFAVNSEVRSLGALGVGTMLLGERGRIVSPVGVLTDGTRVFSLAMLDANESPATCPNSLFTIAAGSTQPRRLDVGGCRLGADLPAGPVSARVGGDRRVSRPRLLPAAARDRRRRRPHRLLASAPQRQSDIVAIDDASRDAGPQPIDSCTAAVLTPNARVREGQISVRLRCPGGLQRHRGRRGRRDPAAPALILVRGRHAHGPPHVSRAARRSGRLRLQLALEAGPERSALIRPRR